MDEQKTSCVECGHPISIDYDDPCPNCAKENPRFKNVGIEEVAETIEKLNCIQLIVSNDFGNAKELFKLKGYKIEWDVNKPLAFVWSVITAFSVILIILPVSNSWALLYLSAWNTMILGFILLILGIVVGLKAFTKITKPHESEF